MKRGIFLSLAITMALTIFSSTSVFAYKLASSHPNTKTLYYGLHSSLPQSGQSAAISHGTWSSSDGLWAYYNFEGYTGNIDPTDSNNSVGGMVSNLPGAPSGWIAAAPHPASNYSTFDIVLNSNQTFGNGTGTSYFDYEGVFAHEFGHVFGLDDVFPSDPECEGKTYTTLPTMYSAAYYFGMNVYYYSRSVTADDIAGKAAVASSIVE